MQLRVGIFGVGMWGKEHIRSIREEGRGDVAWVYSRTAETVKDVQREFGVPHGTQDYHDVLRDPTVQAVIVSTPPYTHAALACDVLRAGKHLLLEKPLALSAAEAARIETEAIRQPRLVALEASCRFSRTEPRFDFVRQLIADGGLGRIYHVSFIDLKPTMYVEYNPAARRWASQKHLAGGGALFDWGEYDLSFLLGVLGDRPQIKAVRGFHTGGLRSESVAGGPITVEQHGAALLEFDTGLTLYYERGAGVHGDVPAAVRLHGTTGALFFSYYPWHPNELRFYHEDTNGTVIAETVPVPTEPRWKNANTALIAHFMDCIEEKAAPLMPIGLARKHFEIVTAMLAD